LRNRSSDLVYCQVKKSSRGRRSQSARPVADNAAEVDS